MSNFGHAYTFPLLLISVYHFPFLPENELFSDYIRFFPICIKIFVTSCNFYGIHIKHALQFFLFRFVMLEIAHTKKGAARYAAQRLNTQNVSFS